MRRRCGRIAAADDALCRLERPLGMSCKLELLDFENEEGVFYCISLGCKVLTRVIGKKVFWHSSAHVLGEACEKHYGCNLCLGPPTDEGFFYEMSIADRTVTPADYPGLETLSKNAVKEKQKFERLVMKKEDLLEMFHVREI